MKVFVCLIKFVFLFIFVFCFEKSFSQVVPADSTKKDSQKLPVLLDSSKISPKDSVNKERKREKVKVAPKTVKRDSVNYGVRTTIHFYEKNIFQNRYDTTYVDTLIKNFHRYNILQKSNYNRQDLGMLGSASKEIYYKTPTQIGTTLGYTQFDSYVYKPAEAKYYNTMSPYTDLYYMQGGMGRTWLNIDLGMNIKPDWNVTVSYQRVEADHVFGRSNRENQTYASNDRYAITSYYFSPEHRYKMLVNASYYEHKVNETGGYAISKTERNINTLLDPNNEGLLKFQIKTFTAKGKDVTTSQKRSQIHLYHQYNLFDSVSALQIFHSVDISSQINQYSDPTLNPSNERPRFYKNYYFDTTKVRVVEQFQNYQLFDTKAGVKGTFDRFLRVDYMGFVQARRYKLDNQLKYDSLGFTGGNLETKNKPDSTFTREIPDEFFAGGSLSTEFQKDWRLTLEGTYMFRRDYQLKGELITPYFTASYAQTYYQANLLQREFRNQFFAWKNNFQNILAKRGEITATYRHKLVTFKPFANYTELTNYVYNDTLGIARQNADKMRVLQVGANLESTFGKFHLIGNFVYSALLTDKFAPFSALREKEKVIKMPTFQATTQFYFEDRLFRGGILTQVGIDLHWKSAYYADMFMPATQQFYLQNSYKVENYLLADAYLSFKISDLLLFLKMTNLLQDVVGNGYFSTPLYFAQPRSVEIGINWRFFD